MKRGLWITFEGPEGSGKSTQIRRVAAQLRKSGWKVISLREPGGTKISEAIREILLDRKNLRMTIETELLLYLAARAQIVREKIFPALDRGCAVLCDRYEDSTLAYQGFGRGMSVEGILELSQKWVRGNRVPEKTFLLDVDPRLGLRRGERHDRLELQSMKFHESVRKGFLSLASSNPKRIIVLDALQDRQKITSQICKELSKWI